jgi:hypothetical protein
LQQRHRLLRLLLPSLPGLRANGRGGAPGGPSHVPMLLRPRPPSAAALERALLPPVRWPASAQT